MIRYGLFTISGKDGDNAFRLNLTPYIQIYFIMNIENFKLYELALVAEDEGIMLPLVEDLAPKHMSILLKDAVL